MSHPAVTALTPSLNGKIAFITGAGAGFGRDFSRAFAEAGAAVAVTDVNLGAAEETARQINAAGGRAVAAYCDVSSEESVKTAVDTIIEKLGGIDILINNAGRHLLKYNQPFSVLSTADVRELFDVNVMGVIFCTLACKHSMRKRGGGAVVNIASIAAHLVPSPYGVSKLAVRGLTMAFAKELSGDGIRVNAISPGLIATESALAELPKEMMDAFRNEYQLIKRRGEMPDITAAALFLCSAASSFITGETLKVSGGYPLDI